MDRETNGCLLICGPSSTTWHSQTKNRMGAFWENRFWNFGLKWPFVACPLLSVAFWPAQFNLPRTFLARGIDCRKNWSSQDPAWCRKSPFYALFCVFWHKKGKNKIKMMGWKAESALKHLFGPCSTWNMTSNHAITSRRVFGIIFGVRKASRTEFAEELTFLAFSSCRFRGVPTS